MFYDLAIWPLLYISYGKTNARRASTASTVSAELRRPHGGAGRLCRCFTAPQLKVQKEKPGEQRGF